MVCERAQIYIHIYISHLDLLAVELVAVPRQHRRLRRLGVLVLLWWFVCVYVYM